jgi:hypothetical protein
LKGLIILALKEFDTLDVKEFMAAITVRDYQFTTSSMDVYLPTLMVDKSNDGSSNSIVIPSDIFKSKENIAVTGILTDLNYITIKISPLFTATYRSLGYDSRLGVHFPKGTQIRIYVPDLNIDNALVVPLF